MRFLKFTLLSIVVSMNVVAQESSSQSDIYRSQAREDLQISLDPFSAESLRLHELRRKAERLDLEQTLERQQQIQPNHSDFDPLFSEINESLFQQQSDIDALNLRIDELLESQSQQPKIEVSPQTQTDEVTIDDEQAEYPRKNPNAVYYGMIDFGSGPEILFYDSYHRQLRHSAVNEFAPRPMLLKKNGRQNDRVTQVNADRARIGTRSVLFPPAVPFLFLPTDEQ